MLDFVTATRFDRPMSSGKSRPSLIVCERESGEEVEVIAKFSEGFERKAGALVAEAVAAMLAADLKIPTPEPFLVRVDKAFTDMLQALDPVTAFRMSKSVPVAFGSRKLPAGFTVCLPEQKLRKGMATTAAEIFAFDALIQNSDRRPEVPNCLSNGDEFACIDHELAFMTEGVLGWQPPWIPGSLESYRNSNTHLFFRALRGNAFDLSRLQSDWQNITDQRLSEYRNALPLEWSSANSVAVHATRFIGEIRDNIVHAIAEVKRVLR